MNRLKEWLLRRAITHFLKGEYMDAILNWFSGKKTYVAAVSTAVVAMANLVGASIPGVPAVDHSTSVQMLVSAILATFLRQGISKSGPAS